MTNQLKTTTTPRRLGAVRARRRGWATAALTAALCVGATGCGLGALTGGIIASTQKDDKSSSVRVPQVDAVSPNSARNSGGTQVTISGSNFASNSEVSIAGVQATVTSAQSNQLIVTVPAVNTVGPVSVTVSNPSGGSTTLSNGFMLLSTLPVGVEVLQPGAFAADDFNVAIVYRVTDPDSAESITLSSLTWEDLGSGQTGNVTIGAGQGLGALPFGPSGVISTTIWNSLADIGFGNNRLVRITMQVTDSAGTTTAQSGIFTVSNGPLDEVSSVPVLHDVAGGAVGDVFGADSTPDLISFSPNVDSARPGAQQLGIGGQISVSRGRGTRFDSALVLDMPTLGGAPNFNNNFFESNLFHPAEGVVTDADGDSSLDVVVVDSPYAAGVDGLWVLTNSTRVLTDAGTSLALNAGSPANVIAHQQTLTIPQTGNVPDPSSGVFESAQAPVANGSGATTAYSVVGFFAQDVALAELDPAGGGGDDLLILHGIGQLDLALGSSDVRGAVVIRKRAAGGALSPVANNHYLDPTDMGAIPTHIVAGDLNASGATDLMVVCSGDNSLTFYLLAAPSGAPDTIPPTYGSVNVPIGASLGLPPADFRGAAIGDLNGDGRNDFVVVTQRSQRCLVFINDPGATDPTSLNVQTGGAIPFRLSTAITLPGLQAGRPAIEDVDANGRNDILVPLGLTNELVVYANLDNRAADGVIETTETPLFGVVAPPAPGTAPLAPPAPAPVRFPTFLQPQEVIIADLNRDKRPDVVLPCGLTRDFSVMLQATQGTLDRFVPVPAQGIAPLYLASGDLDPTTPGDEIACSLEASNQVSIFGGAASVDLLRTYSVQTSATNSGLAVASQPFVIKVEDVDGDGQRNDVLSAMNLVVDSLSQSAGGWFLARNYPVDETGTSVFQNDVSTDTVGLGVASGDFLGADGIPDVVVCASGGGSVISLNFFQGLGGGGFAPQTPIVLPSPVVQLFVQDLDGDTFNDIILSTLDEGDGAPVGGLRIWWGDGLGVGPTSAADFSAVDTTGFGAGGQLAIGDLNNDNRLDLAVCSFFEGDFAVYFQGAGRVFTGLSLVAGLEPVQVAIGDLNGDGLNDLALPYSGDDVLAVYYQTPGWTAADPLADVLSGAVTFPTASGPAGCVIMDVNGDTQNDVVVAARGADQLNIFIQR